MSTKTILLILGTIGNKARGVGDSIWKWPMGGNKKRLEVLMNLKLWIENEAV